MDVVGDIVSRERRSDDIAFRTASRAGSYSYAKCCTNAWKAGNLLRHYGVREGAKVAIDAGERPSPQPLVGFLGAALLGATVRFAPSSDTDARALLVPAGRVDQYEPDAGTSVLAYGGAVDDPAIAHFEREAWSENPTTPPEAVTPDATVLTAFTERFTHERLLAGASTLVNRHGIDGDTEVAIRAPLSAPGTVVAGLLAPLLVGGTVLLDRTATGTVAVGSGGNESSEIDPTNVL
jgi:hypothetical protein